MKSHPALWTLISLILAIFSGLVAIADLLVGRWGHALWFASLTAFWVMATRINYLRMPERDQ